jgi:hypothetical protein
MDTRKGYPYRTTDKKKPLALYKVSGFFAPKLLLFPAAARA